MSELKYTFCVRLHEATDKSGKSVRKIAKEVGICEKTMYGYYIGFFPKVSTLLKICESLDVSADYLLGRTDKMEVNR